jgi:hypothetical protein
MSTNSNSTGTNPATGGAAEGQQAARPSAVVTAQVSAVETTGETRGVHRRARVVACGGLVAIVLDTHGSPRRWLLQPPAAGFFAEVLRQVGTLADAGADPAGYVPVHVPVLTDNGDGLQDELLGAGLARHDGMLGALFGAPGAWLTASGARGVAAGIDDALGMCDDAVQGDVECLVIEVVGDFPATTGPPFGRQEPARLVVGSTPDGVAVTMAGSNGQQYLLTPRAATVLAAAVRELAGVAFTAGMVAGLGGTSIGGLPGPVVLPAELVVVAGIGTPGGGLSVEAVPAGDGGVQVGLGSPPASVSEDDAWGVADALEQAARAVDSMVGPYSVGSAL